MASHEKTIAVVGMLCEAFRRKASDLTFEAYHLVLRDVTDEQLVAAGRKALLGTGEWMPTAGQLRELALLGGESAESRAAAAYDEFDAAVARYGADKSVSFADGLINATVRALGGWIWCCGREGEAYHTWQRREFLAIYTGLLRNGAGGADTRGFLGRLAMANGADPNLAAGKNCYLGQEILIPTRHSVIAGPTERKRISGRNGIPALELKSAGGES